MQSSFFSYSSKNLQQVLPYEQALINAGLQVWRDKNALRAGEFWPMRLGEAIDQQDSFILFWSVEAQASSFVTLEWNTAIALGKTIIPVLLDNTPLPASLRALHVIETEKQLQQATSTKPDAPQKTIKQKAILKQLENAPEAVDKVLEIVTQYIQHQSNQNNWKI
ncbi:MAG: toll/interleukin-1 receptor domain-containing protein, partial [Cocleimonas sp.]|nr:toll/interleukin-1 receptor domain-containing protein [Cocleimonas sp.]